jgi:Bacterial TSP3 repeat/IPT/TIG domain
MRRLIISSLLSLAALAGFASAAYAAAPVITSFSPAQVRVGQKLVINGKNFKKGVRNNRVFFIRASDGKTVRTRPSKASSTRRMEVIVPAGVVKFLTIKDGVGVATRFQLQLLSGQFSKTTAKSRSPLVLPAGGPNTPTTPGSVGVTPPPAGDCDADGTPDATDGDDDNDGLSDGVEAIIHTDPCKQDSDGDGVGDAYEYYASLDLNANPNYAGKRPYPNPLDAGDANSDFDGDGLTQTEEFAASVKFGTATTAPLTYSDGNQQSVAPANAGAMDLDNNGRITDDEKDADNDGLANWLEIAKAEPDPSAAFGCSYAPSTGPGPVVYSNIYTICNGGPQMPNGRTFGNLESTTTTGGAPPPFDSSNRLNYLDPDTDGDGITDAADDEDFDGVSNAEEIVAGADGFYTNPEDPCDPNPDSRSCPVHPSH